ncbi:MAG: hypothetical protein SFZ02_06665, partial [bacterium]|nr:hypothetical protein [bacterium]
MTRSIHIGLFALVALISAIFLGRYIVNAPNYTDAYYYLNIANRIADGKGLTDATLFTYIGATDGLPQPSHLYWMPLTSLIAGVSMALFNAPYNYVVAQLPFIALAWIAGMVGFWVGNHVGKTPRHAWMGGLLTLFSGFYARYWGVIDGFAPYAVFGAGALIAIGLALENSAIRRQMGWWGVAGILSGFGHLTRADGLLLLLVAGIILVFHPEKRATKLRLLICLLAGYLLIMGGWFIRNMSEIGSPLPIGGAQGIWYREYDDLFAYPTINTPQTFFEDGLGVMVQSRSTALIQNMLTFIAVQGMVIMTPFMCLALWKRRKNRFLWAFALYAIGLHVVMTVVFPFPGYRGGLLHSAIALIPFWGVLGVLGIDDVVDWISARLEHWKPIRTKRIFSIVLLGLALIMTATVSFRARSFPSTPQLYQDLKGVLPPDAVLMINDPPALYYHAGFSGVVIPNADVSVIPEIAKRYGVTHVVIETFSGSIATPKQFIFDTDNPPSFLMPIESQ